MQTSTKVAIGVGAYLVVGWIDRHLFSFGLGRLNIWNLIDPGPAPVDTFAGTLAQNVKPGDLVIVNNAPTDPLQNKGRTSLFPEAQLGRVCAQVVARGSVTIDVVPTGGVTKATILPGDVLATTCGP